MRHGYLALLMLLAACMPVYPAPRSKAAPHRESAKPHCSVLASGEGRCIGWDGGAILQVTTESPLRTLVARSTGGAYALTGDGRVLRYDPRGRFTGEVFGGARGLVAHAGYLCIVADLGDVLCARDHAHDRACEQAPMGAFRALPLRALEAAAVREDPRGPCVFSVEAPQRCVPLEAPCNRHCLAFPACGPLRCLDPCPNDDADLAHFFSSESPAPETTEGERIRAIPPPS